ncbi:hypothetical protein ODY43_02270 [Aerococcus urinae]|uniref:Uncharacterized protein n=1 Tax=Aerococcus urinae TaxID=1376 RepID=A0ABT4C318_9LACT|nr:hypothetical protein [Aerococcus urinae]MCY3052802.1 hypothetical protein [Aerococcus urinae]MCY3058467.1 hypothetical protein [Aerococcus urinae]
MQRCYSFLLSPSELQTVRTAKAYDPIFHIACWFMANDQLQSSTPAHNY